MSSRAQAVSVVVAAVVVAVVIGAWALVVEPQNRAAAAEVSASHPAPSPSHALRVAVIGDSYTAGVGLSKGEVWSALLGAERGWTVWNYAEGGTGYVKRYATGGAKVCGTDACPNYGEVVPDVVAAEPDVVIVAGGRNDGALLTPELDRGITGTYQAIRKGLPNVKIIGVAPILAADDSPASFPEVKPAVERAVEAVGGSYVDLGAPLGGHPELIQKDGVHPNADGQKAIAAAAGRVMPR